MDYRKTGSKSRDRATESGYSAVFNRYFQGLSAAFSSSQPAASIDVYYVCVRQQRLAPSGMWQEREE